MKGRCIIDDRGEIPVNGRKQLRLQIMTGPFAGIAIGEAKGGVNCRICKTLML